MGKQDFPSFVSQYLENSRIYAVIKKLLLMTNRKLHMRFLLAPGSMTLDDLELLVTLSVDEVNRRCRPRHIVDAAHGLEFIRHGQIVTDQLLFGRAA